MNKDTGKILAWFKANMADAKSELDKTKKNLADSASQLSQTREALSKVAAESKANAETLAYTRKQLVKTEELLRSDALTKYSKAASIMYKSRLILYSSFCFTVSIIFILPLKLYFTYFINSHNQSVRF